MANTVSVVITILNEATTLVGLLEALKKQSYPATEIVVVDGGSTDTSLQILKTYQKKLSTLKIFSHPGNRSVGRNYGTSQSKSKIIAFTDAGCLPHKNWLELLVRPFLQGTTQAVSGYYTGHFSNTFEKCLLPYVLVMPDQVTQPFFPSTRSMAILKSLFLSSGGFDESLYHNEDYAYAHKLYASGIEFYFQRQAKVTWMPRKSLKSAIWMFFRFALGDIQAGILRPKVKLLAIRYFVGVYIFFLGLESQIFLPIFGLLALLYLSWSVLKNFRYVKQLGAIFWLPVLQLTSDLTILFGSLVGLMYRISTR